MKKSKKYRNRLKKEQSPYLLQHATNPVDWYPWGAEAFERAKKEKKPIFLSIGYATCHWCHVMAHESFEDPEVARLLNQTFICIKVDREERPDIDHMYMTTCQLMTGTGGWPLTIILTPDKVPFFSATYIPKHSRYNRKGMVDLIPELDRAWHEKQDTIVQTANQLRIALDYISHQESDHRLTEHSIHGLFKTLCDSFDRSYGGFGNTPKFPSPHTYMFLLRYWHVYGDPIALTMVEQTLGQIITGGIHDHVEGGFHRYATDRQWFVPHFEKMLYDQALLMIVYAELYQVTQKDEYKNEINTLADYVRSRLTAPDHGFFSAEDADSEGVEGKFYLWSYVEIQQILERDAAIFCQLYDIQSGGNYQEETGQGHNGLNILHRKISIKSLSKTSGIDPENLKKRLDRAMKKVRRARARRVRPFLDDKILTDWNGLMIAALAIAGRCTGLAHLIDTARKAASFINAHLRGKDGRLFHRMRGEKAGLSAYLDDYAFMSWGLIELYRATYDTDYLAQAVELSDAMIEDFWDRKRNKGFYFSSIQSAPVLVHQHITQDGAMPSGNSVAYYNLQQLSSILNTDRYASYLERLEYFMTASVQQSSTMHAFFLGALLRNFDTPSLITIAGDRQDPGANALHRAINERFLPFTTLRFNPIKASDKNLQALIPDLASYPLPGEEATAHVCADAVCFPPTADIATILKHTKYRSIALDSTV
jgi:uncharacterized protein YyaL (SSP411 family)